MNTYGVFAVSLVMDQHVQPPPHTLQDEQVMRMMDGWKFSWCCKLTAQAVNLMEVNKFVSH